MELLYESDEWARPMGRGHLVWEAEHERDAGEVGSEGFLAKAHEVGDWAAYLMSRMISSEMPLRKLTIQHRKIWQSFGRALRRRGN